jgi:hypothetical protein
MAKMFLVSIADVKDSKVTPTGTAIECSTGCFQKEGDMIVNSEKVVIYKTRAYDSSTTSKTDRYALFVSGRGAIALGLTVDPKLVSPSQGEGRKNMRGNEAAMLPELRARLKKIPGYQSFTPRKKVVS